MNFFVHLTLSDVSITEVFIIQISFAQLLNLKKKKNHLDDIVSSRQRLDSVICKVQREIFQQHYPKIVVPPLVHNLHHWKWQDKAEKILMNPLLAPTRANGTINDDESIMQLFNKLAKVDIRLCKIFMVRSEWQYMK